MNSFLSLCLLVGMALFLLPGCVAKRGAPHGANAKARLEPSKLVAEIETVEAQAIKEVMSSPTTFVVPYPEAPYSWERAKLFFERYTTKYDELYPTGDLTGMAQTGEVLLLSNPSGGDLYLYQVKKISGSGGFAYTVNCWPRHKPANAFYAGQNAHNLARFIREGKLELSLLKR